MRGTAGGYINEDFALGIIIDYAEHREEYLANAGVRLNENMRMIGSVGILKESEEFTLGDGREDVSQLEYGLSVKGNYEAGIVRGFEINAYHTNASSDTDSVETGDLTGIQFVTQLKPAAATDIRLGAGYEKAQWDGGDIDEGFTLQAVGAHKLSDKLALNFQAKSAETENVYGLGLAYDLSSAEVQNNALRVDLMHIQGKHGISDDTRVALNWTVGFGGAGAGAAHVTASSMGSMARADLLADVMTRPAFLPERVLARATESGDSGLEANCPVIATNAATYGSAFPGETYYTARNLSVTGGRLFVMFMANDDSYVTQNYYDLQTNMATAFLLNGISPTSTLFSGGGTYGVDGYTGVYWDDADTLFGVDPATVSFTVNHNGGTCSYTLARELLG